MLPQETPLPTLRPGRTKYYASLPKFSVEGLEVYNNSTTTVKKKCLVAPDCSPYEHVTSQCLIGSAEVVERAESSTETKYIDASG